MSEEDLADVPMSEGSTTIPNEVGEGESIGASLLTGEVKDQSTHAPESEKQETLVDGETADPLATVPTTPEEYQFDFNNDVQIDTKLLESFKATAHELRISQGQAQKLAELYANHTAESSQNAQNLQVTNLMKTKNDWESEITSRPFFEQEVVDARRTLKEFGSPELNEIMDSSLLGSHPVFFDFVVKVGKALAEPEVHGHSHYEKQEKPLMDRLWPNMK